jgi:hypothetical protein
MLEHAAAVEHAGRLLTELIVTEEFAKVLDKADNHDDRRANHPYQEQCREETYKECRQLNHGTSVLRNLSTINKVRVSVS